MGVRKALLPSVDPIETRFQNQDAQTSSRGLNCESEADWSAADDAHIMIENVVI